MLIADEYKKHENYCVSTQVNIANQVKNESSEK